MLEQQHRARTVAVLISKGSISRRVRRMALFRTREELQGSTGGSADSLRRRPRERRGWRPRVLTHLDGAHHPLRIMSADHYHIGAILHRGKNDGEGSTAGRS